MECTSWEGHPNSCTNDGDKGDEHESSSLVVDFRNFGGKFYLEVKLNKLHCTGWMQVFSYRILKIWEITKYFYHFYGGHLY